MTRSLCVLVTGATGYIGGRLTPHLLRAGYRVRVLIREPSRLMGRSWLDQVDVVQGDVLRAETLPPALESVDVAYYFIHSLAEGSHPSRTKSQPAQDGGSER